MNIKPLGSLVLVRPLDSAERTDVGIYLPEEAREKSQEGMIVELGPFSILRGQPISKVLFARFAGTELFIDKVRHLILKETDILAVVED